MWLLSSAPPELLVHLRPGHRRTKFIRKAEPSGLGSNWGNASEGSRAHCTAWDHCRSWVGVQRRRPDWPSPRDTRRLARSRRWNDRNALLGFVLPDCEGTPASEGHKPCCRPHHRRSRIGVHTDRPIFGSNGRSLWHGRGRDGGHHHIPISRRPRRLEGQKGTRNGEGRKRTRASAQRMDHSGLPSSVCRTRPSSAEIRRGKLVAEVQVAANQTGDGRGGRRARTAK
jgi:hypothetical protein